MKDTKQQTIKNVKEQKQTIKQVEETPFALVTKDGETKIIMGNYLMSNKVFESEEKAIEYINEKPWELMTPMVGIIAEKVYFDIKNNIKKD